MTIASTPANVHITILYGAYSRYDLAQTPPVPFSGSAGAMFKHRTFDLNPENTYDIRVVGTDSMARPFYPATRFLALGKPALRYIQQDDDLNKNRGLILTGPNNCPAIATYSPIDCWDFTAQDDEDDDDDDKEDAKDVGPTSRANFLHWALHDYRKLLHVPWPLPPDADAPPFIGAPMPRIISWLDRLANTHVVIDIETRRQDHSLDCIGFRAFGATVVVPIYRHTNQLYYTPLETAQFWLALVRLFLRKGIVIVGHNLGFDIAVLAVKYHLPIPCELYDTMLAMHREYPQLEKSLSHALGVYTLATRNHKADIAVNVSASNFQRLLAYNGNDVLWTERIYLEQLRRAAKDGVLAHAVAVANKTLRATMMISVTGTVIDLRERERQIQLSLLKAQQYTRIVRILTGEPEFNPCSPQQVARYFYTKLRYPCEDYTESGAMASGTKTLYKLQVKQPNPLIPLIVAAREQSKAHSALEFRLKRSRI